MPSKKIFKKPRLSFVCLLLLLLVFQSSFVPVRTFAAVTVNIDPNITYKSIEGWGSSICWWGNQIGGWSEKNRNSLIEKIISPIDGLGYNIFRYNIGGGDAPSHNHMRAYGNIEGYQPSPGVWNWNADATQRAVLNRLLERGRYYGQDMIIEAFSNSPPYWMTKSGCASGNTDGSNNLKDDCYDDFAEYLTEVVKHFRDTWGITFRTLEPMNEPNVNWWKANGGQEGCCFTFAVQPKIIKEVGSRLKSKGLTGTTVSAADENSIDTAVSGLKTYDAATLSYISQVNTHSYSGSQRTSLRELVKSKGKKLWQSESGPLSFTGEMMDSNIMMSQRIVKDLKEMQADAWIDWQIIDGGNWGSIYVNNSAQTFTLTKKFYMHSNYSRFIRPGYTIIGADNAATLAALSPDKKKLVIVATNAGKTASESFTFNLSRFLSINSSVEVYRTSASLDLAKSSVTVNSKSITDTLPAYSINTYVVSLGDNAVPTPDISTVPSPTPDTTHYKIVNENSGKVLDVTDSSLSDGAGIIQQSDNGSPGQKWYFTDAGDGYRKIVNCNSGKTLDVNGQSVDDGGKAIQWPSNEGLNQQWSLEDNGNGYYKIVNRNSGKLLDVSNESKNDGASIIQWHDTNGKNQHWKLIPAGSATPTPTPTTPVPTPTTPTPTPTTPAPTRKTPTAASCDLNGDGVINMVDVNIMAKSFNSAKGDSRYVESRDLNGDGAVNMHDIVIIAARFNTMVAE